MDSSLKREILFFQKHPDILLELNEYDIRDIMLKLFENLHWNAHKDGRFEAGGKGLVVGMIRARATIFKNLSSLWALLSLMA